MMNQPPLAHWSPDTSTDLLVGTIGDTLRRTTALFPRRRALAWPEGDGIASLTYAELLAQAEQVAAWLLAHAPPQSRIAVWSRNSVEWILVEYGCALAGMTIASWNPGWTDFECRHARDLTDPALLLAGFDTRGEPLIERGTAIMGADRVHPLEDLRSLIATARGVPFPPIEASDPFLIQFTSGTTGKAKGATMSHRVALNGAWLRAVAADADETDVWINPVPLNHTGGAVSLVLGCMTVGACYVVMNRFDPVQFVRLMQSCGATRIGGVPTMIYALLDQPGWTAAARDLRSVGSGGAQVPRPLIERLLEDGVTVIVTFAQSECPMISSTLPGEDPALTAETVGRPIAHTEVKICHPQDGQTLQVGEVGEICVRGPVVMDGYFRMPEATAATIDADYFLHTGDLGSLDAAGYLRIHGRVRDVIIRGGENIYPAEVEDCLLTHPDVQAVAVVAVPDARWGQAVGAAIQLREGVSAIPTDELEAHAAERIAHFKVPRRWRFVESLPLTPSGKVRKVEVEALFV